MTIETRFNLGDIAYFVYQKRKNSKKEFIKCQIVQIRFHADGRWNKFDKKGFISYQVIVWNNGRFEWTRNIVESNLFDEKDINNG